MDGTNTSLMLCRFLSAMSRAAARKSDDECLDELAQQRNVRAGLQMFDLCRQSQLA
jgi:hypothetical protein